MLDGFAIARLQQRTDFVEYGVTHGTGQELSKAAAAVLEFTHA